MLTEERMKRTFTIQAKAVEKIIRLAAVQGVKPESLYEAVKLDPAVLLDRDNRIPFAQLVALYEKAAELTGDDNFGLHLGESIHPSAFDVVGYSALNSPTLGAAFKRVSRYHSIWTDGALFTLESSGDTSAIVYRYADTSISEHRQDSEMTLATVATLCRNIASPDFVPGTIEFQHEAPADISEHLRLFRCPVQFGAPENRFTFASSLLSLPIAKAHAEELLEKYPPRDSSPNRVPSIVPSNAGPASRQKSTGKGNNWFLEATLSNSTAS